MHRLHIFTFSCYLRWLLVGSCVAAAEFAGWPVSSICFRGDLLSVAGNLRWIASSKTKTPRYIRFLHSVASMMNSLDFDPRDKIAGNESDVWKWKTDKSRKRLKKNLSNQNIEVFYTVHSKRPIEPQTAAWTSNMHPPTWFSPSRGMKFLETIQGYLMCVAAVLPHPTVNRRKLQRSMRMFYRKTTSQDWNTKRLEKASLHGPTATAGLLDQITGKRVSCQMHHLDAFDQLTCLYRRTRARLAKQNL